MIVGIDLGTTYSAVAYLNEDGKPEIIPNDEGEELTPSVVMIDGEDIIVGTTAKKNALIHADQVRSKIKIYMGEKKVLYEQDGERYTPEMLSNFIIQKLVKSASERLNQEISGVVVTVPAYFSDAERKATEDAVRLSGTHLVGMIDEPTAAALHFCDKNAMTEGTILVYDFGGGTFDATLFEVNGKTIKILRKSGDHEAGGSYFDEYIADYVADEIFEKYDIDLREDHYSDIYQEILLDAEKCKIELSNRKSTEIIVRVDDVREAVKITREQFDKMISRMYNRTESTVKGVLEEQGMRPEEVDKILLVGGSSQIPFVRENLEKLFEKPLSYEVDASKAVALGAAIYGNICLQEQSGNNMILEDVCAHGIGIVLMRAEDGTEYNNILIPANSSIPINTALSCATYMPNQKYVPLKVTEGDFEELEYVNLICEEYLELPRELPKNTKVNINISLDERQLVHVFVDIPVLNLSEEYEIRRISNMTEEELKQVSGLVEAKNVI